MSALGHKQPVSIILRRMAGFGGKAATRQAFSENADSNVCFSQYRKLDWGRLSKIDRLLTAISGHLYFRGDLAPDLKGHQVLAALLNS